MNFEWILANLGILGSFAILAMHPLVSHPFSTTLVSLAFGVKPHLTSSITPCLQSSGLFSLSSNVYPISHHLSLFSCMLPSLAQIFSTRQTRNFYPWCIFIWLPFTLAMDTKNTKDKRYRFHFTDNLGSFTLLIISLGFWALSPFW